MKSPILEDIVIEDLKNKEAISRTFSSRLASFIDTTITRHPITTSSITFGALEYIRYKHPELIPNAQMNLAIVYSFCYIPIGLIKENILEARKIKIKNPYNFFLENPRISALAAYISLAFATYYGELKIEDFDHKFLKQMAIAHGVQASILTEVISRGLNNLRKIKTNIKRTKTSLIERLYNTLFEHPIALSVLPLIYNAYATYHYRTAFRINHNNKNYLNGNLLEDVINNPGALISIASRAGFETSIWLGMFTIGSSILHTHTLKDFYYRAARKYNSLFRIKDKAIKYQERLVALPHSVEKSIEDIVILGNMHYEKNNRDQAFTYYRKALRLFDKKSTQISYADFFRKSFRIDKITRLLRKNKINNLDDEESLINRVFIGLLNKDIKAAEEMKKVADNNPEDASIRYMYGKVLDILGYKESAKLQKIKAIDIVISKSEKPNEYSGSKNLILSFDNNILRGDVIAKVEPLEKILSEIETTENLRKITKDHEDKDVPIPIGAVEINGKTCYVMELASGELLADKIKDKKIPLEEFHSIADYLGLIHAKLTTNMEERYYIDTIKKRLDSTGLEPTEVNFICVNLMDIDHCINNIIKCYNKDAHPRNWKVDEFGGIIALDLEEGRLVPLTFDTANLISQYHLDEETQDSISYKHFESFSKYSKIDINFNDYRLAYLNSVIIRTFEIYYQVKDQNKEVMVNSLNNAIRSIKLIEKDFNNYYKQRKNSYNGLAQALIKLKKEK